MLLSGGAREVGRAAALHGHEAAVGPGEAVHQRLADDDDLACQGAAPSVEVAHAAGQVRPDMPVDERSVGGLWVDIGGLGVRGGKG